MTIVVEGAAHRVAQASRHSEVNQESPVRFESNNQILAAPLECADPLALELGCHGLWLERPDQTCVLDLDPIEATPDQPWFELETDRLNFRQLGHLQAIVSSTIGRSGGAFSPSS